MDKSGAKFKFVGHSTEIILQSKNKGTLRLLGYFIQCLNTLILLHKTVYWFDLVGASLFSTYGELWSVLWLVAFFFGSYLICKEFHIVSGIFSVIWGIWNHQIIKCWTMQIVAAIWGWNMKSEVIKDLSFWVCKIFQFGISQCIERILNKIARAINKTFAGLKCIL